MDRLDLLPGPPAHLMGIKVPPRKAMVERSFLQRAHISVAWCMNTVCSPSGPGPPSFSHLHTNPVAHLPGPLHQHLGGPLRSRLLPGRGGGGACHLDSRLLQDLPALSGEGGGGGRNPEPSGRPRGQRSQSLPSGRGRCGSWSSRTRCWRPNGASCRSIKPPGPTSSPCLKPTSAT